MRQGTSDGLGSRVVVKIGTSSLVTEGKLDLGKVDGLCDMVAAGIRGGLSPVLVASGAIALGRARHDALAAPTPAARQAAAALGQGLLYSALQERFAENGHETGQILLTPFDLTEPERNCGVRAAFDLMHTLGLIPIVNENDALGVRNNDVLAAILSGYLGAELLLLLTDVPCLYDADPLLGGTARRVVEVTSGISAAESIAGGSSGTNGTGGMLVKLAACWIATYAGIRAVIANAVNPAVLVAAYRGDPDVGTVFYPRPIGGEPPDLGRLWRSFRTPPRGSVVCDPAGLIAVSRGSDLLRRDVIAVRGSFDAGDVVDISGQDGAVVARGSIRWDAAGLRSSCSPTAALFIGSDYVRLLEGEPCR